MVTIVLAVDGCVTVIVSDSVAVIGKIVVAVVPEDVVWKLATVTVVRVVVVDAGKVVVGSLTPRQVHADESRAALLDTIEATHAGSVLLDAVARLASVIVVMPLKIVVVMEA